MPNARHGDLDGWWRSGLAIAEPTARTLFRIRVLGAEHVPRGAAVVAANHVSALDGVLLAIATARSARRMTRFLVAAEFFERRRFGWALRRYRQIPVRRGTHDTSALDTAIETVAGGAVAAIFPEGRVNPEPDGRLQRGHRGVARIALAAGAPIVPVAVWGTQRRWPLSGLRLRRPIRPIVAIAYGTPISPGGQAESEPDVDRCTADVMTAIREQVRIARASTDR